MELTRVIAISVIAASLGLGAAVHAQSLKNVHTPNEFPAASYKGKQYVDSKGCVYIRAGVDGAATWVPRMTRSRKVVCGYKPTVANAKPNTASAAKLDSNVVVIQPAAPPTTTAAAAPATRPSAKPRSVKPKPKVTTTTVATAPMAKPPKSNSSWWNRNSKPASAKPTTTVIPKPKPTPKPTTTTQRRTLDQSPRRSGFDTPCRAGVVSKHKVRCGPQSQLPYTPGTGNPTAAPPRIIYNGQGAALSPGYLAPGSIVREGEVASNVRVVPLHVYEARQLALNAPAVPEGYRRAFDDGRLNPRRAEQTFAGKAAMDSIWQQKTPRKLIPGADVASVMPSRASTSTITPVISTKSANREKSLRLSGQSYVQVQTYSNASAAQKAAQQLRAMGLPAKIGKYARNGQTYRMVLAGPFGSDQQADTAAAKLHRKGYDQAFVRN